MAHQQDVDHSATGVETTSRASIPDITQLLANQVRDFFAEFSRFDPPSEGIDRDTVRKLRGFVHAADMIEGNIQNLQEIMQPRFAALREMAKWSLALAGERLEDEQRPYNTPNDDDDDDEGDCQPV